MKSKEEKTDIGTTFFLIQISFTLYRYYKRLCEDILKSAGYLNSSIDRSRWNESKHYIQSYTYIQTYTPLNVFKFNEFLRYVIIRSCLFMDTY